MSRFLMGFHVADLLLTRHPDRVQKLYYSSTRLDARMKSLLKLVEIKSIPCVCCDMAKLSRMVRDDHHQGVVMEVSPLPPSNLDDILDGSVRPVLLVLDGVMDPHNLGACMRVADATGVTAVLVPKNNSAGLTSVVVKSSSGATEFVQLVSVANLSRALKMISEERDIDIVGTDDKSDVDLWSWHPEESSSGLAVVLGSEGGGMRRLTRERCRYTVRIPMYGCVSSLNVSVASGVILYYVRQRLAST